MVFFVFLYFRSVRTALPFFGLCKLLRNRGMYLVRMFLSLLVRRIIVNRTYGADRNLYVLPIFPNNVWSYLLWSPVIGLLVWEDAFSLLG